MAQDVETEDVGQQEDSSRDRRRGVLSLVALLAIVLLLLWLLWQFFGSRDSDVSTVKTTSESAVTVPAVTIPDAPEPEVAPVDVTEGATVPDVVGQSESYAQSALESAGYAVKITSVNSSAVRAGIVISQNPGGGSVLAEGGTVGIVVSRGVGAVVMVTMPDVIGLTQSAAEAKVRAAGLKPYILHGTDTRYPGLVGSQWPLAGEKLPKGGEGFIQVMIAR